MRTDLSSSTGSDELLLAVSIALATAKWKVALHDGQREKPTIHTVADAPAAGGLHAVLDLIDAHKQKWSLPEDVRVAVSYEAGQAALWIYH
jgi:transposase